MATVAVSSEMVIRGKVGRGIRLKGEMLHHMAILTGKMAAAAPWPPWIFALAEPVADSSTLALAIPLPASPRGYATAISSWLAERSARSPLVRTLDDASGTGIGSAHRTSRGVHDEHRRSADYPFTAVRWRRVLRWWPSCWRESWRNYSHHPHCHVIDRQTLSPLVVGAPAPDRN